MFKVGDLVTAKEYNSYAITDKGKPCEIVAVSISRIKVKCLWGEGEKFWVYPEKFRPMSKDEIFKPGQKLIAEFNVVKPFVTLKNNKCPKTVTFVGYRTYGVKVRDDNGEYLVLSMHSVKGVVKGGLHV